MNPVQAEELRLSCPLSCGLCESAGTWATKYFHDSTVGGFEQCPVGEVIQNYSPPHQCECVEVTRNDGYVSPAACSVSPDSTPPLSTWDDPVFVQLEIGCFVADADACAQSQPSTFSDHEWVTCNSNHHPCAITHHCGSEAGNVNPNYSPTECDGCDECGMGYFGQSSAWCGFCECEFTGPFACTDECYQPVCGENMYPYAENPAQGTCPLFTGECLSCADGRTAENAVDIMDCRDSDGMPHFDDLWQWTNCLESQRQLTEEDLAFEFEVMHPGHIQGVELSKPGFERGDTFTFADLDGSQNGGNYHVAMIVLCSHTCPFCNALQNNDHGHIPQALDERFKDNDAVLLFEHFDDFLQSGTEPDYDAWIAQQETHGAYTMIRHSGGPTALSPMYCDGLYTPSLAFMNHNMEFVWDGGFGEFGFSSHSDLTTDDMYGVNGTLVANAILAIDKMLEDCGPLCGMPAGSTGASIDAVQTGDDESGGGSAGIIVAVIFGVLAVFGAAGAVFLYSSKSQPAIVELDSDVAAE